MPDPATHPRPQLVREAWHDLCGPWCLGYDDDDRGVDEGWWRPAAGDRFDRDVVVPYPPESELSGLRETGHHPVVWYRRSVVAPHLAQGHRLLLHLGAVDHRASVWLDGQLLGSHEGGHVPFTVDVTPLARPGEEQVLVVRAEDRPTDVTQPRGKQDWRAEPHGIWYHRTSGIWQPVWFETVPDLHVEQLAWTPDVPAGQVVLDVVLNREPPEPATLSTRLRLDGEVLAEASVRVDGRTARQVLVLPAAANGQDLDRLLWTPESPTLLDADVVLRCGSGAPDAVTSYVGFRSAGVGDGAFLLNGHPYYLRLVLEQGYWPRSHLAAPEPDALRREVELIKELGFNGARVHQKVEDPRFLHWCDRLGLLVWGEMANAYASSPQATERLVREWLEVVRRDRSHPCVVTWVPLNESWGVQQIADAPAQRHLASAMYHLTKALDPTRPALSNDGWEHTDSDVWGVHDYGPGGAGLRERYGTAEAVHRTLRRGRPGRRRVLLEEHADRGQPVVLTEVGGVSFAPAAGEEWFGYSTVGDADELLAAVDDIVRALLDSPHVAGFCWTQLTDTEQERNGLLTADREPKVDPALLRAVLTRPSRAVPAEEVDRSREEGDRAAGGA